MKIYSILGLISLLSACGGSSTPSTAPVQNGQVVAAAPVAAPAVVPGQYVPNQLAPQPRPLMTPVPAVVNPAVTKMSPADWAMLKEKYTKLELKCEMRLQRGTEFDPEDAPNATASWNLLTQSVENKVLDLNKIHGRMSAKVQIVVNSVEMMDHLKVKAADGTYTLAHTPVLKGGYTYQIAINLAANSTRHFSDTKEINFVEGIKRSVMAKSLKSTSENGNNFYIHVDCLLDHQLKPKYEKDFQEKDTVISILPKTAQK